MYECGVCGGEGDSNVLFDFNWLSFLLMALC